MSSQALSLPAAPFRLAAFLSRSTPYFRGKWRLWEMLHARYFSRCCFGDTVRLRNGPAIYCELADLVPFAIWCLGSQYEQAESRYLLGRLRADTVMLDVGANVGYYSLVAAPRVRQVHAFEPVSRTFSLLSANVKRNGYDNVTLNRLIVSDCQRSMTINVGAHDNTGHASVSIVSRKDGQIEEVQAITLDSYCAALERVDLIKIDVEGHELSVLRGASTMLKRFRPDIFIEIRDGHLREGGSSRQQVYDFLNRLGWRPFAIGPEVRAILEPEDGKLVLFAAPSE